MIKNRINEKKSMWMKLDLQCSFKTSIFNELKWKMYTIWSWQWERLHNLTGRSVSTARDAAAAAHQASWNQLVDLGVRSLTWGNFLARETETGFTLKEIRSTYWLDALSLPLVPKLTCFSWASWLMFASLTQFPKIPGNWKMCFSNSMVAVRIELGNFVPTITYSPICYALGHCLSVRSAFYWHHHCGHCELAGSWHLEMEL